MNTTHKATPYTREYRPDNGTDFRSIDYALSYSLGLSIAESIAEALSEADPATDDLYDIVLMAVDSVRPIYYHEILDEWREAGCPDPDDSCVYDDGSAIWELMGRALHEAMLNFAFALVGSDTCHTPEESLERVNAIYPYKTN